MIDITLNWSSGKDAAMAYLQLFNNKNYQVRSLLTTLSSEHKRISMHGIREEVLDQQAALMNVPLQKIYLEQDADIETYNNAMRAALAVLRAQSIGTVAFGDIFLEDLRSYREQQLATENFKAVFPLWNSNTSELVEAIEDSGIKAIIVCVNDHHLGKEFLGKEINRQLLQKLPANVDPCGEKGEYHTLVIDAPFFSEKLKIKTGEMVYKTYSPDDTGKWDSGFYFLDILPG